MGERRVWQPRVALAKMATPVAVAGFPAALASWRVVALQLRLARAIGRPPGDTPRPPRRKGRGLQGRVPVTDVPVVTRRIVGVRTGGDRARKRVGPPVPRRPHTVDRPGDGRGAALVGRPAMVGTGLAGAKAIPETAAPARRGLDGVSGDVAVAVPAPTAGTATRAGFLDEDLRSCGGKDG